MDFKPAVEQFIYNCFRERTEALKLRLAVHQDFRRRFYHDDCSFDSRRGVVEKSKEEKIISISITDLGADVVTTGNAFSHSCYHLRKSDETWLIQEVDYECSHLIETSAKCPQCGGTGWWSWKNRSDWMPPIRRKQPADLATKEELDGNYFSDADVEEFMAEHFRDRAVARKRELEILNDHARRFYGPECDWTRWGPYGEKSNAETILGVKLIDPGVRVITSGFGIMRLRYHLCPSGLGWLIWQVDTECVICGKYGRNGNCILCGGTIWGRRRDMRNKRAGSSGEEPPGENPRWQL